MTIALDDDRAELLDELTAESQLFCGLDYDGTLAPLAPTPGQAVPFPGTEGLLRRLAARPGRAVAIVTGRAGDDGRALLALDEAYYVGIHGLELKRPGGAVTDSSAGRRAREILPALIQELRARIAGRDGLLIEEKGAAVALHYRLAAAKDAAFAREQLDALLADSRARGEQLDRLPGHEVVEIRPAGVDKGRALCELLDADAPRARALYIGDDRTDEDAFRALPPSAVTIRVGDASVETRAAFRLSDPAAVHSFLQRLAGGD